MIRGDFPAPNRKQAATHPAVEVGMVFADFLYVCLLSIIPAFVQGQRNTQSEYAIGLPWEAGNKEMEFNGT